jgi:hypothetical protein
VTDWACPEFPRRVLPFEKGLFRKLCGLFGLDRSSKKIPSFVRRGQEEEEASHCHCSPHFLMAIKMRTDPRLYPTELLGSSSEPSPLQPYNGEECAGTSSLSHIVVNNIRWGCPRKTQKNLKKGVRGIFWFPFSSEYPAVLLRGSLLKITNHATFTD